MMRRTGRTICIGAAGVRGAVHLIAAAAALGLGAGEAEGAGRRPPEAAIAAPAPTRHPFPGRGSGPRRGAEGRGEPGGWWLGTAGIAAALAAFGAISLASRRHWPQGAAGPLKVVGRTSLSPRHTVYLLRAGGRVLIVGTGPQGAPSLLGELTDSDDLTGPEAGLARVPAPALPGSGRPEGDDR